MEEPRNPAANTVRLGTVNTGAAERRLSGCSPDAPSGDRTHVWPDAVGIPVGTQGCEGNALSIRLVPIGGAVWLGRTVVMAMTWCMRWPDWSISG
jgi:hypothetical protein